jgi:hypothetical protein
MTLYILLNRNFISLFLSNFVKHLLIENFDPVLNMINSAEYLDLILEIIKFF